MNSEVTVKGEELVNQIQQNDSNLTELFEVHFQKIADRQQNLLLNQIKDRENKLLLTNYLKKPQNSSFFKQKLRKDTFIEEVYSRVFQYLNCYQKEYNKKKSVEDIYEELLRAMHKKQSSKTEPLTCYKEYVDLSQKIQKSFILKKDAVNQKATEDNQKGKCGFKMKTRERCLPQMCNFCHNNFQNTAGLNSHLLNCKLKYDKIVKTKRITRNGNKLKDKVICKQEDIE